MSREIKFRRWDGVKMWEGSDLSFSEYGIFIQDDWDSSIVCNDPIMQYTGIKVASGVEVYEGDIITATWFHLDPEDSSASWEVKAAIEFVGAGFKILPKLSWYGGWLDLVDIENIQVIVNIYENPELIKET